MCMLTRFLRQGFCTDEEYEAFMEDVPKFEQMLVGAPLA